MVVVNRSASSPARNLGQGAHGLTITGMNRVWTALLLSGVGLAAWLGKLDVASTALIDGAKNGFEVTLSLIAALTLWLGLIGILERAGAMDALSAVLSPILQKLFTTLPPRHPAFGAMAMNMSSTMLGLQNASTPFGLTAMKALHKASAVPHVATNAMVLFLVLNTSGVQILPVSVITLRAALGSKDPSSILLPAFVATLVSMILAVICCLVIQRWFADSEPATQSEVLEHAPAPHVSEASHRGWLALVGFVSIVLVGWWRTPAGTSFSSGVLILFVCAIVLYGWSKRVPMYEAATAGAREGPLVALRILPFLVVVLSVIQVLRSVGVFGWIEAVVPDNDWLPGHVIPQLLLRPLTGSGTLALVTDTLKTAGPDSYAAHVSSILYGSSETTFYVLAVYFGSVGVTKWRHTLLVCLLADALSAAIGIVVAHYSYF